MSAPHKKSAGWMPALVIQLYFQTIRSEGVNPPFLKLYIRLAMKRLKKIKGKRGLDNIFPKSGKGAAIERVGTVTKLVWGRAPVNQISGVGSVVLAVAKRLTKASRARPWVIRPMSLFSLEP